MFHPGEPEHSHEYSHEHAHSHPHCDLMAAFIDRREFPVRLFLILSLQTHGFRKKKKYLTKIDPRVSPPRETARRPLLERGKKKAKKNRENEKITTFYVFIVLWTLAWMKKKSCLILQKKLSHWRRYRSVDTCLDEKEELSHFAKKIDSLAPVSYSGHLPG